MRERRCEDCTLPLRFCACDGTAEFAPLIETGMRRVPNVTGFDAETTERLQTRLAEFDAVRNRGAVESRTAYLHWEGQ